MNFVVGVSAFHPIDHWVLHGMAAEVADLLIRGSISRDRGIILSPLWGLQAAVSTAYACCMYKFILSANCRKHGLSTRNALYLQDDKADLLLLDKRRAS